MVFTMFLVRQSPKKLPFWCSKAFMKECLSANSDAKAGPANQQSKMKTCNVDAKGIKGDERKAFMKECLSKKAA